MLSDLTGFVDKFTHWDDKMKQKYDKGYGAAKCYNDETLGNNIGFGKKGHRPTFPGSNNPTGLDINNNIVDYFGPVSWGTFLDYAS